MKHQRITPAYKARRIDRNRRPSAIAASVRALAEQIRSIREENERSAAAFGAWARASLLPPDAAAAVEENFGKLPTEPSVPFESSQRWGRSRDGERWAAVKAGIHAAMAKYRTAEELERLLARIVGRSLDSLEQEFCGRSPDESGPLRELPLPILADSGAPAK